VLRDRKAIPEPRASREKLVHRDLKEIPELKGFKG
jgi:hypothetical protein